MRGERVLRAQVYACVISSLCMQILAEDGHGDRVRMEDGGGDERRQGGMEHVQEMNRVRKGEGRGERWCDDRAAGTVFVHASAGKLITRWSLTPLKC